MFVMRSAPPAPFSAGSGRFDRRCGPVSKWPGRSATGARGKGYATEAARAAIGWSFASFPLDRIVWIIDPGNLASREVAERVGQRRTSEQFTPFREPCEVWEIRREAAAKTFWKECGVKVLPGTYLAQTDLTGHNPGAAYIRVALVDDLDLTREAFGRLAGLLS